MLFSVTQASIVTSAIATPAPAVIKDNIAHTAGKFVLKAGISMAIEPTKPETIKQLVYFNELFIIQVVKLEVVISTRLLVNGLIT
ncbi:hypothetical protein Hanom_Chr09g00830471 [Helianthus anomalus]